MLKKLICFYIFCKTLLMPSSSSPSSPRLSEKSLPSLTVTFSAVRFLIVSQAVWKSFVGWKVYNFFLIFLFAWTFHATNAVIADWMIFDFCIRPALSAFHGFYLWWSS